MAHLKKEREIGSSECVFEGEREQRTERRRNKYERRRRRLCSRQRWRRRTLKSVEEKNARNQLFSQN